MTPRQRDALVFIRDYIDAHAGVGPTFLEIQEALGLASKSSVARLVEGLEEGGHIVRGKDKTRGLRLPMPNLTAVPTAVLAAELARREAQG